MNMILYVLYMIALSTTAFMVVKRRKQVDKPTQVLVVLFVIGLCTEIIAWYATMRQGANLPVYMAYSWAEIILVVAYIRRKPGLRRSYWLYVPIALAIGACLWALTQGYSMEHVFSGFMVFSYFTCLCLSLYALFRMLLRNDLEFLTRKVHFWILTLFNVYWVGDILTWTATEHLAVHEPQLLQYLYTAKIAIKLIVYTGWSVLFFYYPKMKSYAG